MNKFQIYCVSVITLVIGVSVFWASYLPSIQFNYDLEKFFPKNDEETTYFKEFRSKFGNDDDYLLLGIQSKSGIFNPPFLEKVNQLTLAIDSLEVVNYTISPTNIKESVRKPLRKKPFNIPWLHIKDPARYPGDSIRIFSSELVEFLFSSDRSSICIYIKTEDFLGEAACKQLNAQLDSLMVEYAFDEVHIAGKCIGQTTFIQIVENEVSIFIAATVLLVAILLWITYRNIWGVLIPLSVVGLTVLWTIGLMIAFGKSIDFISNIIPVVLLVIGVADVIHLLTHYQHYFAKEKDKLSAIKKSVWSVGKATLLTTITTAFGFLSLTTSSFQPLVELGIYATVGIVFALILTYLIVPIALWWIPAHQMEWKKAGDWKNGLQKILHFSLNQQRLVLGISLGIVFLGILLASQIKINNYILEDLREGHPQRTSFDFFANQFAGPRPLVGVISVLDTHQTVFELPILRDIEQIDSFLVTDYGIKNLISPATLIKKANQIYHFGDSSYFKIPKSQAAIDQLTTHFKDDTVPFGLSRLLAKDYRQARTIGDMPDWGSLLVRQKNEALKTFLDQSSLEKNLTFKITGSAYLMDLNNYYLASNVLVGLVVAIIGIAGLFSWLFRSWALVLISLLPNLIPLLFIAGVMGALGISLKISTSIIFIISFGIAVDDSIHFIAQYRLASINGLKHDQALRQTYFTTGKAIVLTSITLFGGFLVLCLSQFLGTFYIGLLVAITLLIAMVADLTLLPILLDWFGKKAVR